MYNLISYFLIINVIGLSIALFLKIKSKIEVISLCFPLGATFITFYMWLLSICNVAFSKGIIFTPIIIISTAIIIIKLILNKNILLDKFNVVIHGKIKKPTYLTLFNLILISCIIVQVLFYLFHSISTSIYQPDELSYWGLQPKIMYLGNSINSLYGGSGFETGFDRYPNFMPLIVASIYYYFGFVIDSFSRFIGPVFLVCLILFLYNFLNTLIKSKTIILLLLATLVSSGEIIFEMSSGLYADIVYTFFYTVSVVYLYNWFYKSSKGPGNLILSSIFMGFTAWIKIDGLYMIFVQSSIIILFIGKGIFINFKSNIKNIALYVGISLVIPLLWKFHTSYFHFPDTKWVISPHYEYLFPMLRSSISQLFDYRAWGFVWYLVTIYLILGFYIKMKKNQYFIFFIIIANFSFLYICYLLVFTQEAPNAASFGRYILRIVPLSIILISTIINDLIVGNKKIFLTNKENYENSNNNTCIQ